MARDEDDDEDDRDEARQEASPGSERSGAAQTRRRRGPGGSPRPPRAPRKPRQRTRTGDFRLMTAADLPRVLEIEGQSFRQPWDEERFLDVIGPRNGLKSVVFAVDGKVLAYVVLQVDSQGLHILNLAVAPEVRRRGIATLCLTWIERVAQVAAEVLCRPLDPAESTEAADDSAAPGASQECQGTSIRLEVEESNLPAQLLYRKMGYRAVEILRNHYKVLGEDGYRMVRQFGAPTPSAITS